LLELRVDLALNPGLALPPLGQSLYGYPRAQVYLVGKPSSLTLDVDDALAPFHEFFSGVGLSMDPRVEWAGLTLPSTAAAVTILHPTRAKRFRPTNRWITLRFEEAMAALDRVLTCIGFVSGIPNVGALRRTDFPASVLVCVNDQVLERNQQAVLLTEFQVHSFEEWRERLARNDDVFQTAIWLNERLEGVGAPVRLFVEYVQRAQRDLMDGRPDQAVISATTAVETLAAAVLTQIWRAEGNSHALIESRLDAGFRNLLRHHLAPYMASAGIADPGIEDWLAQCYRLRNKIAHEGYAPSQTAAIAAFAETLRLGVAVAEALRSDAHTRELGESIPLRFQTPEEIGRARLTQLIRGS